MITENISEAFRKLRANFMRKELINGLLGSFDNKKDVGFSGRKMTALTFALCGVYANYQSFNLPVISDHLAISILVIDVVAAAFFIGLVTADQIIKFKGGGGPKSENATENKPTS